MVRTLVFHTNNVGSIPTGLKITNLDFHVARIPLNRVTRLQKHPVRYSFRFMSLIPPISNNDFGPASQTPYTPLPNRLFLKRSYLILSWLFYMSTADYTPDTDLKPRLAVLPARNSKYTLTKAPMAHKTNSKEQFLFRFYKFKFSFTGSLDTEFLPGNYFQAGHGLEMTKNLFPVFETNLLFLKTYEITYPLRGGETFFTVK